MDKKQADELLSLALHERIRFETCPYEQRDRYATFAFTENFLGADKDHPREILFVSERKAENDRIEKQLKTMGAEYQHRIINGRFFNIIEIK